ncbi:MAG: response regulator transcription factor [Actinomycetia bacterium]|nr:response regulator transcription factor [Actinomycetes bacterium]
MAHSYLQTCPADWTVAFVVFSYPTSDEAGPKVLVLERRPLIAGGLLQAVAHELGWAGLAAHDADTALREYTSDSFQVVLCSVSADDSGVWFLSRLLDLDPDARSVAIVDACGHNLVPAVMAAGSGGCVGMDVTPVELADAIRAVVAGEVVMDPTTAAGMGIALRSGRGLTLTSREIEVLANVADGMTLAEVASRLIVSVETVRDATRRIYRKFGVHTQASAVAEGFRRGLLA